MSSHPSYAIKTKKAFTKPFRSTLPNSVDVDYFIQEGKPASVEDGDLLVYHHLKSRKWRSETPTDTKMKHLDAAAQWVAKTPMTDDLPSNTASLFTDEDMDRAKIVWASRFDKNTWTMASEPQSASKIMAKSFGSKSGEKAVEEGRLDDARCSPEGSETRWSLTRFFLGVSR
ncbi:hypothetical protein P7C73_g4638, partial [Tremellales sp. Uapishka_1]